MANITEKEIGKVYDGYWQVIKCSKNEGSTAIHATLRNMYNGKEVTMGKDSFYKLKKGKLTVSKFIYHTNFKRRNIHCRYWYLGKEGSYQL